MLNKTKISAALAFLLLFSAFAASNANAKANEYDAVCKHLENKFQAKKVKIPFMWLARFAVGVVRPAGVKSFKVTTYTGLQFSRESLDAEMRDVMSRSFSEDWTPILRVRSKNGEQVYMNMRESGKSVKIMFVTINETQATVVRARFNPEKLAEFINNPKIFGISLDDNDEQIAEQVETKENAATQEKKENQ